MACRCWPTARTSRWARASTTSAVCAAATTARAAGATGSLGQGGSRTAADTVDAFRTSRTASARPSTTTSCARRSAGARPRSARMQCRHLQLRVRVSGCWFANVR
eukprot:3345861-Rhodomonas_salina.2